MKVIGRDESVVRKVTCRNCASIIEYTNSELQESSGTDISGTGYTQHWFSCPTCKARVVVRET